MNNLESRLLFERIRRDLKDQDFAVIDRQILVGMTPQLDGAKIEQGIRSLANVLGIGEPYLPELYKNSACIDYTQSLFNHIGGPSRKSNHPAFSSQNELNLHTDGTLNYIGEVRLTILGCITEAQRGGESVLFRAAALAEQVMREDRDILAPFFDPRAMRRHATIDENLRYAEGPLLKWVGGELLSSYCTTPRDEWRYDVVPGLREARRAFEAAISDFPNLTCTFPLKCGQALVMDNSRLSHGRLSFTDNPSAPRYLLRGLFRNYPGATA